MLTSAVAMAWPRLHATAACTHFQLHNHEHAIVCTGKAIESSMHKEWFMPSRPSLSCIKLIFPSNDGGMYIYLHIYLIIVKRIKTCLYGLASLLRLIISNKGFFLLYLIV